MGEDFPYGFTPGESEVPRRWLQERPDKLLGQHLPIASMSQWPDVSVVPGYALNRVVPTHFRAYTRTPDGAMWGDAAETHDEARWKLEQRVRDAGW